MSKRDQRIEQARRKWRYTGEHRPGFAHATAAGEESVWDYPRPPRLVRDTRHVVVTALGIGVADTYHAVRVLETGGPPTFYLPPQDVRVEFLIPAPHAVSFCEWKGSAEYFAARAGDSVIPGAAWRYAKPFDAFRLIAGYFSFYPGKVECYVDGERVKPQPGSYYGGWVTHEIIGPFKGEPGTADW